jgi:hypothetical protein
MGNFGLTRLTTTRTREKPPPSPILYTSPRRLHPNGFLSRDFRRGVPRLPGLGLPQLCAAITTRSDLRSRQSLKQTCNSHQELSNGVSHATCTHRNRVNSRLFVVGSQIANLTPNLSFCLNLCYRYPNGSCEPILKSTLE